MFWTTKIQKNLLILIGFLSLSYVIIFLVGPKDIADYTVADTTYWRETDNRLLLKPAYDYSSKEDIQNLPINIGTWKSYNFRYSDAVYAKLNADIFLSRAYVSKGNLIWMDIINSKTGESFHNQRVCVEGAGWNIDNESIVEFRIANQSNGFTTLRANKLDISQGDKKQVMLYWFIFKKFGGNDAITMIRLSAPVVYNRSITFNYIKSFVEGDLFNAMYKGTEPENITLAEYIIRTYGKSGIIAIILAILAPIGLICLGMSKASFLK